MSFRDRVVQHSFCDNLLEPFFERRLIYDCAACRKGKGTHFAMDRLNHFLRAYYRKHGTSGWILKCDVRKYFDSIDHEALKKMLEKYPDPVVRSFLNMVVDSYHKDKQYLKECLNEIRGYAEETLKLEFNQKTQIFPVSQGVDYLGWHFYLNDTGKVIRRLRTSNKRRFKRRLKKFQKLYSQGDINADRIKMSLASYNGHLKHGHTWKLKKKVYGKFVLTRNNEEVSDEDKENGIMGAQPDADIYDDSITFSGSLR